MKAFQYLQIAFCNAECNKDLRNGKLVSFISCYMFEFQRFVMFSLEAVKYAGHCDILVFTKTDFLDAFVIIVRMYLRNDAVPVSVHMHRLHCSRLVNFWLTLYGDLIRTDFTMEKDTSVGNVIHKTKLEDNNWS